MKKLGIIILMMMSFAMSSCTKYNTYKNADKYESGDFEYTASDITKIEINWVAGEINFIEKDTTKLRVSENSSTLNESEKVHHYLDENILKIEYAKSGYLKNINSTLKKINIEVPKGISIEIEAVSCNIEFNTHSFNELSIETVSGNIEASKINASKIEVESVSGNVSFNRINTSKIEVNNVSGNVFAKMVEPVAIDIETVSGDTKLVFMQNQGFTLDFETVSGKFTTQLSCVIEGDKYQYLNGNCLIEVETVSGDLEIKEGE